jgi:uncharacterized protein
MDPKTFISNSSHGDESAARHAVELDPSLASLRNEAGVSVIATTVYAGRLALAREFTRYRDNLDLFEAASVGDFERVRTILSADLDCIDHHGPDGFSAIGLAAALGHLDLLAFLIDRGADLENPSGDPTRTRPLHRAAAHSNSGLATTIARILLEAGADPNAQRKDGHTSLHQAVLNDNIDLVNLLIRFGANPHVSNDDGDSALQLAHAKGKNSMIDLVEKTFRVE